MPIEYQRDDERRVIIVTVTEPWSVDGISSVIERQSSEGTWDYPLLYDLRALTDASAEADLEQIAVRVRAIGGEPELGRVGIAIPARPALFLLGLMYANVMKDLVTVEVLLTAAQIASWLSRNARSGESRRQ